MMTIKSIASGLAEGPGYVAVEAPRFRALAGEAVLGAWPAFAQSWDHLVTDEYMADGGRFRRRRFARFLSTHGVITREPHGPHFQSRDYNPLNGGIDRWFEPVTDAVAAHPVTRRLLDLCVDVFTRAAAAESTVAIWKIEMLQFRIEPSPRELGRPTPEGMHRDGVDYVLVLLINRRNIASGTTTVHDLDKRALGSFTLTDPLDAALVDDARCYHGVTPVEPEIPAQPAYRDVLVVTFKKKP